MITKTHKNGDTYTGSLKFNQRNGFGKLKQNDGNTIIGQWRDDYLNGFGFISYKKSTEFIGTFSNGVKHGIGRLRSGDKIFEGEFVKGERSGYGEYVVRGIEKRRGKFINGEQNGYGEINLITLGQFYEGSFIEGKPSGFGKHLTPTEEYIGEFLEGKKHGVGKLIRNDGTIFSGKFKLGKKNGFGIEKQPDQVSCFFGVFDGGARTGPGREVTKKFTYTGGVKKGAYDGFGRLQTKKFIYIGSWRSGKRNGLGYLKMFSSSYTYFGSWKMDKREGFGYEIDGIKDYKGEFAGNQKHGRGFMKISNGVVKSGIFEYGSYKKSALLDIGALQNEFKKLDLDEFFAMSKAKLAEIDHLVDTNKRDIEGKVNFWDYNFKKEGEKLNQKLKELKLKIQNVELAYTRCYKKFTDDMQKAKNSESTVATARGYMVNSSQRSWGRGTTDDGNETQKSQRSRGETGRGSRRRSKRKRGKSRDGRLSHRLGFYVHEDEGRSGFLGGGSNTEEFVELEVNVSKQSIEDSTFSLMRSDAVNLFQDESSHRFEDTDVVEFGLNKRRRARRELSVNDLGYSPKKRKRSKSRNRSKKTHELELDEFIKATQTEGSRSGLNGSFHYLEELSKQDKILVDKTRIMNVRIKDQANMLPNTLRMDKYPIKTSTIPHPEHKGIPRYQKMSEKENLNYSSTLKDIFDKNPKKVVVETKDIDFAKNKVLNQTQPQGVTSSNKHLDRNQKQMAMGGDLNELIVETAEMKSLKDQQQALQAQLNAVMKKKKEIKQKRKRNMKKRVVKKDRRAKDHSTRKSHQEISEENPNRRRSRKRPQRHSGNKDRNRRSNQNLSTIDNQESTLPSIDNQDYGTITTSKRSQRKKRAQRPERQREKENNEMLVRRDHRKRNNSSRKALANQKSENNIQEEYQEMIHSKESLEQKMGRIQDRNLNDLLENEFNSLSLNKIRMENKLLVQRTNNLLEQSACLVNDSQSRGGALCNQSLYCYPKYENVKEWLDSNMKDEPCLSKSMLDSNGDRMRRRLVSKSNNKLRRQQKPMEKCQSSDKSKMLKPLKNDYSGVREKDADYGDRRDKDDIDYSGIGLCNRYIHQASSVEFAKDAKMKVMLTKPCKRKVGKYKLRKDFDRIIFNQQQRERSRGPSSSQVRRVVVTTKSRQRRKKPVRKTLEKNLPPPPEANNKIKQHKFLQRRRERLKEIKDNDQGDMTTLKSLSKSSLKKNKYSGKKKMGESSYNDLEEFAIDRNDSRLTQGLDTSENMIHQSFIDIQEEPNGELSKPPRQSSYDHLGDDVDNLSASKAGSRTRKGGSSHKKSRRKRRDGASLVGASNSYSKKLNRKQGNASTAEPSKQNQYTSANQNSSTGVEDTTDKNSDPPISSRSKPPTAAVAGTEFSESQYLKIQEMVSTAPFHKRRKKKSRRSTGSLGPASTSKGRPYPRRLKGELVSPHKPKKPQEKEFFVPEKRQQGACQTVVKSNGRKQYKVIIENKTYKPKPVPAALVSQPTEFCAIGSVEEERTSMPVRLIKKDSLRCIVTGSPQKGTSDGGVVIHCGRKPVNEPASIIQTNSAAGAAAPGTEAAVGVITAEDEAQFNQEDQRNKQNDSKIQTKDGIEAGVVN